MNMLSQEAAKREVEQEELRHIHGVNSFTNHGHVNLMILSVSDPDQMRKVVQELLQRHAGEKAQ